MKPPGQGEASAPRSDTDAHHARDVKVLVVEDDERQRKVTARILREMLDIHGITVHEAPDVASARTACGAWRPGTLALMVLDWRLPDGTAQDVLDAAVATGADLHVDVLTTESAAVPADDRWTVHAKPFRLHGLRVLLSDIVHGWWAQQGAALQARAAARGIQFEVEVAQVKVHGDAEGFRHVLYSLLADLIGAVPAAGSIRVELEHPRGRAQVRVRHAGRGLAPDEMRRLFQHFPRMGPEVEAEGPDAGFGLLLTTAIVSAYGGRIWVEGDDHDRRIAFSVPVPGGPPPPS